MLSSNYSSHVHTLFSIGKTCFLLVLIYTKGILHFDIFTCLDIIIFKMQK